MQCFLSTFDEFLRSNLGVGFFLLHLAGECDIMMMLSKCDSNRKKEANLVCNKVS